MPRTATARRRRPPPRPRTAMFLDQARHLLVARGLRRPLDLRSDRGRAVGCSTAPTTGAAAPTWSSGRTPGSRGTWRSTGAAWPWSSSRGRRRRRRCTGSTATAPSCGRSVPAASTSALAAAPGGDLYSRATTRSGVVARLRGADGSVASAAGPTAGRGSPRRPRAWPCSKRVVPRRERRPRRPVLRRRRRARPAGGRRGPGVDGEARPAVSLRGSALAALDGGRFRRTRATPTASTTRPTSG